MAKLISIQRSPSGIQVIARQQRGLTLGAKGLNSVGVEHIAALATL
jgi:hypothetical protein